MNVICKLCVPDIQKLSNSLICILYMVKFSLHLKHNLSKQNTDIICYLLNSENNLNKKKSTQLLIEPNINPSLRNLF